MSQMGFYFNMDACTGCKTCEISCKDKNRLENGMAYRCVNVYSVGTFPTVKGYSFSSSCNHCAEPACMAVCPVGAILKLDDGTIVILEDVCIGCDACIAACPYGVPQKMEDKGIVGKCDACAGIRAKGGNPACVDACPARALDFGEMEDLQAKYGSDTTNVIAVLPDPSMTMPSLLIRAREVAMETGFKEIYL